MMLKKRTLHCICWLGESVIVCVLWGSVQGVFPSCESWDGIQHRRLWHSSSNELLTFWNFQCIQPRNLKLITPEKQKMFSARSSQVLLEINRTSNEWPLAIRYFTATVYFTPNTNDDFFFYFCSETRPTSYFLVDFSLSTVICLLYIIWTRKIEISPTFRSLIQCSLIFPGSPRVRICSLTKVYTWLNKSVLVLSKTIQMRLITAGLARQDKRTASGCLRAADAHVEAAVVVGEALVPW